MATRNRRPLQVPVERLAEQRFFVAKGGIETRTIDAQSFGQVRQRRALISLSPEHHQRAVQRSVEIEGAGTSHSFWGFVPFHTYL